MFQRTTAACRSGKPLSALLGSSKRARTEDKDRIMCLGIPGRIIRIDDAENMLATVDVCGVRRLINVSCIVDDDRPVESCIGDWVLVHVGFAMSRIDAEEAAETLKILNELGEAQAELESMRAGNDEISPADQEYR
jgi:hydrogenase expression/formation protein HypC